MRTDQSNSAEQYVCKYADMVYRLALVNMKNRQEAEDVFQDVFLRLVENLHKLENEEHIKAWLIRVTINCCKTRFRSAWRKRTAPLEAAGDPVQEPYEERGEVYDAVLKLPEKYRNVIHLFYFEDMAIRQISVVLKTRENTVKSLLSRGRTMLKTALGEEVIDV